MEKLSFILKKYRIVQSKHCIYIALYMCVCIQIYVKIIVKKKK